jgi:hypothetical protein
VLRRKDAHDGVAAEREQLVERPFEDELAPERAELLGYLLW